MASAHADAVRRTGAGTGGETSDRQLLERFLAHRDEAAFAGLVRRHGGTVWGVCRRVLRQEQDAEDAFQATFLILARKAASIRRGEAVGSWLYRVAYRTALRARRSAARRHRAETQATGAAAGQPTWGEAACRELQRLLDEEVQRLAEKYRAPFVLCCLEGLSKAEAAQELGWKEGTVSGRLAQARKLLRRGLARRGVTLSAVLTAVALARPAAPAALVRAAAQAALAGKAAALSPSAVALAEGFLRATAVTKAAVGALLAATVLVAGAAAFEAATAQPPPPGPPAVAVDEQVWTLAFSPDGRRLATAGGDNRLPGQLQIWDVAAGKPLVTRRMSPGVRSVAYSPDGQLLVTGHWGRLVATGHWEGDIKLRDPLTGAERAVLTGHRLGVNALAFSPDGALLASAGLDKTVKVWDVKALQERQEFLGHTDMVFSVAFFHDGRAIVSGSKDQTARIWDLNTGKERFVLQDHDKPVESVAVSPDDKVVATGSWDRTIKLWDPETGQETAALHQKDGVNALAFSPDGKFLASGGQGGRVYLWGVASRELLWSIRQHTKAVRALAFSPDGKLLASGGEDKAARLWDVAAARDVATLSAVGAEPLPDAPEEATPPAGSKRWLAAVVILGLLLTPALAVWLYVRHSRRAGKTPAPAPVMDKRSEPAAAPAPVSFPCPGCGKLLKVKAELAGRKVKCPQCGRAVLIPAIRASE
jgi:RNA polymerase sigma factor (sigma-70 family)